MSAPIDWTRPLRTTSPGHHEVRVERIDPAEPLPIHILVSQTGERFVVTRDGRMAASAGHYIENVPPEPRIVERFGVVLSSPDLVAVYRINSDVLPDRAEAERLAAGLGIDNRVARILIEEPGDG